MSVGKFIYFKKEYWFKEWRDQSFLIIAEDERAYYVLRGRGKNRITYWRMMKLLNGRFNNHCKLVDKPVKREK